MARDSHQNYQTIMAESGIVGHIERPKTLKRSARVSDLFSEHEDFHEILPAAKSRLCCM
jgi:hypothetical protein